MEYKKIFAVILFLAVAAGGGFFLGWKWHRAYIMSPDALIASRDTIASGEQKAEPAVSKKISSLEHVRVVRVVDGDTIEIADGEHVRYIGIDAPESANPRAPVQCFGFEARRRNQELTEGKAVWLERDLSDRDRYGRLLRYVRLGETMVNEQLVREGYVRVHTVPPDVRYTERFQSAEREAREAGRGLWGGCTFHSKDEEGKEKSKAANENAQCAIKGNVSAAGERIYHLHGCPYYAQTRIDETRGERWFCSEAEAEAAGWRKARNCP